MRSLLGGWSPAVVSLFALIEILACPGATAAQTSKVKSPTASPPAPTAVATKAVVQMGAMSGEVALEKRATSRLENAQRLLFDGSYADALTAFGAVLESGDARGNHAWVAWAQHGMAIAEALAGHQSRSRTLYDQLLETPSLFPIADSIEAAVLTGRRTTARALLDRFSEVNPSVLAQQYARSFRALDLLLAGSCSDALAEVARAPDADRPLPQAIRGLCSAKAGRRAEAMVLRDSVLTNPLADPLSWPMIVARGVALRIR
ncbi:MAG: hypothetical protein ACJ79O_25205 [Myxococcales bacterium]